MMMEELEADARTDRYYEWLQDQPKCRKCRKPLTRGRRNLQRRARRGVLRSEVRRQLRERPQRGSLHCAVRGRGASHGERAHSAQAAEAAG